MTDPRSRAAVEYVERLADGEADVALVEEVLNETRMACSAIHDPWIVSGKWHNGPDEVAEAKEQGEAAEATLKLVHELPYQSACADPAMRSYVGEGTPGSEQEQRHRAWRGRIRRLACLLRDIFGNPFRPVAFDRAWRSESAVALARTMYESREFSAMPILGDALEEAGCNSPEILGHCCGSTAFHVRGCWVVDLVRDVV